MIRTISGVPALAPNIQETTLRSPAEAPPRIFTRMDHHPVADQRRAHRSGHIAPHVQRAGDIGSRIPSRTRSDSPELYSLRNCAGDLTDLMTTRCRSSRCSEIPFITHRKERGTVSLNANGSLTICVNGRKELEFFDMHDGEGVHVMMKGPENRMYAGRNLPRHYVNKANDLVQSATVAVVQSWERFDDRGA